MGSVVGSGYPLGEEVRGQTWRNGTTRGGHRAGTAGVQTDSMSAATHPRSALPETLAAATGFPSGLACSASWEAGVQDRLEWARAGAIRAGGAGLVGASQCLASG